MTTAAEIKHLSDHGLYSTQQEHDACGVGFVAHIRGEKSHSIVKNALKILENLDHRVYGPQNQRRRRRALAGWNTDRGLRDA